MVESDISRTELLQYLQNLACHALTRYALPADVTLERINASENITYRVEDAASGKKWALRIHRPGYHSKTAIASELAWLMALRQDDAATTPIPVAGRDGELIQNLIVDGLLRPRNVVLFEWEEGAEPSLSDIKGFEMLGEAAARMHVHVRRWQKPSWFERHTWDFETSLGRRPHWGRWQSGLGMTPAAREAFIETVGVIDDRLRRFGKSPDRFNLVHGDMRLANILTGNGGLKVIDFDDCGFSWLLYDCATTVSFFEHAPEVADLLKAWVRGYRRIGALSPEEENEIATFVMLRRLLLVAWTGSHSETELAQSMGAAYTQGSIPLCERYLSRFGRASRSSAGVKTRRPIRM